MIVNTEHGVVDSFGPHPLGAEITADAVAGATTLLVEDVSPFAPGPGSLQVVLSETEAHVLVFSAADEAMGTIALLEPLPVGVEAEMWVSAWDVDRQEPLTEIRAGVLLATDDDPDAAGDPVTAVVRHELGGYLAVGDRVRIERASPRQPWRLVNIEQVRPQLDGAQVWNPYLTRRMGPATIANEALVAPTDWLDAVSQSLTATTSEVIVELAGFYNIQAQVSYVANGTGRRYVQILINGVAMTESSEAADPGGVLYASTDTSLFLEAGDAVQVVTRQNSGAALALAVGPGRCRFSMFRVSV